ncbi:MAG: DNA polymerase IV [Chloroflexi bacterium]|nr:DNA polymerase IV [Chloroflexota bacterium]MCY3958296.1 DNA polymerase IV [Chloroflexota bacterium]
MDTTRVTTAERCRPPAEWRGQRVIVHADMDAFYASVEQREQPALRGRPVIVGGARDARGVVAAASYEARAFGVRSAMPLRQAAGLCPQAEFVPGRMRLYADVSVEVMRIFRSYTPLVEPLSLDEAFLDVTGCERRFGTPGTIADHIRDQVRTTVDLPISVGISTSKSVAKIASTLAKPDGRRIVPPGAEQGFLAPLPVRMIWGIGPKTEARLAVRGIRSIGDLARRDPARMRELRKPATLARGIDGRDVESERTAKSVGNEVTFGRDTGNRALVLRYLRQLADHVAQRLRAKGLAGRTVVLKLRYADFRTITRQVTLTKPTDQTRTIFGAIRDLLMREARDQDLYRLVGVHVSGVQSASLRQLALRSMNERDRRALEVAMDEVRARFGDAVVTHAALLGSSARMDRERYAWREDVLG